MDSGKKINMRENIPFSSNKKKRVDDQDIASKGFDRSSSRTSFEQDRQYDYNRDFGRTPENFINDRFAGNYEAEPFYDNHNYRSESPGGRDYYPPNDMGGGGWNNNRHYRARSPFPPGQQQGSFPPHNDSWDNRRIPLSSSSGYFNTWNEGKRTASPSTAWYPPPYDGHAAEYDRKGYPNSNGGYDVNNERQYYNEGYSDYRETAADYPRSGSPRYYARGGGGEYRDGYDHDLPPQASIPYDNNYNTAQSGGGFFHSPPPHQQYFNRVFSNTRSPTWRPSTAEAGEVSPGLVTTETDGLYRKPFIPAPRQYSFGAPNKKNHRIHSTSTVSAAAAKVAAMRSPQSNNGETPAETAAKLAAQKAHDEAAAIVAAAEEKTRLEEEERRNKTIRDLSLKQQTQLTFNMIDYQIQLLLAKRSTTLASFVRAPIMLPTFQMKSVPEILGLNSNLTKVKDWSAVYVSTPSTTASSSTPAVDVTASTPQPPLPVQPQNVPIKRQTSNVSLHNRGNQASTHLDQEVETEVFDKPLPLELQLPVGPLNVDMKSKVTPRKNTPTTLGGSATKTTPQHHHSVSNASPVTHQNPALTQHSASKQQQNTAAATTSQSTGNSTSVGIASTTTGNVSPRYFPGTGPSSALQRLNSAPTTAPMASLSAEKPPLNRTSSVDTASRMDKRVPPPAPQLSRGQTTPMSGGKYMGPGSRDPHPPIVGGSAGWGPGSDSGYNDPRGGYNNNYRGPPPSQPAYGGRDYDAGRGGYPVDYPVAPYSDHGNGFRGRSRSRTPPPQYQRDSGDNRGYGGGYASQGYDDYAYPPHSAHPRGGGAGQGYGGGGNNYRGGVGGNEYNDQWGNYPPARPNQDGRR